MMYHDQGKGNSVITDVVGGASVPIAPWIMALYRGFLSCKGLAAKIPAIESIVMRSLSLYNVI